MLLICGDVIRLLPIFNNASASNRGWRGFIGVANGGVSALLFPRTCLFNLKAAAGGSLVATYHRLPNAVEVLFAKVHSNNLVAHLVNIKRCGGYRIA